MSEGNGLVRYKDQYAKISTDLARAKEKVNLLEAKIELLAISRLNSKEMRIFERQDGSGNIYEVKGVILNASEIKFLMDRHDGDIYSDIFSASVALASKLFIINDSTTRQFKLTPMYEEVDYSNGTLTVLFKPNMEKYILDVAKGFTLLNLGICFSFKKSGALMLYRNLKSFVYKLPDIDPELEQDELPYLEQYYSLAELRILLGFVDIEQAALAEEARKKNPNFEKMNAAEFKPKYKMWSELNRKVLEPGIEEINAKSDIYIKHMESDKSGVGGKVVGVTFQLQRNKAYEMGNMDVSDATKAYVPIAEELSEDDKADFYEEVMEVVPYKIKLRDAMALADDAVFDMERIIKAVEVAKSYNGDMENPVGFLRDAIRGNWSVSEKVKGCKRSDSKGNNKFNEFPQNTYDYEALEKALEIKSSKINYKME